MLPQRRDPMAVLQHARKGTQIPPSALSGRGLPPSALSGRGLGTKSPARPATPQGGRACGTKVRRARTMTDMTGTHMPPFTGACILWMRCLCLPVLGGGGRTYDACVLC